MTIIRTYKIEHRFSHAVYSQAIEADSEDAAYEAYAADPGDFTNSDDEAFDRDDLIVEPAGGESCTQ